MREIDEINKLLKDDELEDYELHEPKESDEFKDLCDLFGNQI